MTLAALTEGARLVVVAGPGGVGKTTSAAAIAVAAARAGRRTLVLTADPARRLADALGIPVGRGETASIAGLPLRAAMLESAQAFDALLPRMVPDAAARRRIEASPVYRRFSGSLARSHAYAALERVHEALFGPEASSLDLVVLDTPPMRGLLDLLDAPEALGTLAASRAIDVLLGEPRSLRGRATQRVLGLLTGPELGAGLAEFLAAFGPFRAGFAERSRRVAEAQRSTATRTVLVTRGDAGRIADARALAEALRRRGVPLHLVLGSATLRRRSPPWALHELPAALLADHRAAIEGAHERGAQERALQASDTERLTQLASELGVALWRTPMLADEPTDTAALAAIADAASR